MSVHRFYLSPENFNSDALILSGPEAHHARDVLRMKQGDRAVLFNGRGGEITAEIRTIDSVQITLGKLHESETPPLKCQITLGQAIPKGKNMDLVVQKAVEIGATEIAPLISDRTVVRLGRDESKQKQAKWQQVAIEAAKQCGQNWLPHVHPPRKIPEFFSSVDAGDRRSLDGSDARRPQLRLIGSLQSDAQHLKKILAEYADVHGAPPVNVLMLIGPEGDFTPAEISLARSHGCRPITLGPIILRVETAAIYCLSVLSYELLN